MIQMQKEMPEIRAGKLTVVLYLFYLPTRH